VEAPEVVPVKPIEPVKPAEKVAKTKFPRFDQVIQEGGYAKRVIWLEVSKDKWKRFDSERDASAYSPEPEAPKADGDKDSPKASQ